MRKASSILAAALCVLISSPAVSAADIYFSDTSIDLCVGDSWDVSLIAKGKSIKYTVSNGKVFMYDGQTVTATGTGTAYLYADCGGKRYTCKITVDDGDVYDPDDEELIDDFDEDEEFEDLDEIDDIAEEPDNDAAEDLSDTGKSGDADKSVTVKSGKSMTIPVSCGGREVYVVFSNGSLGSVTCSNVTDGAFEVYLSTKGSGVGYLKVKDAKTDKDLYVVKVTVKGSDGSTGKTKTETRSEDIYDSYADQVIELVNEQRAARGLKPLEKSDSLMKSAQVRSKEISSKFSHKRPDGSSFNTAVSGKHYHMGENIARNQTTPEGVMKAWMRSEGHKANILDGSFRKIGVAYNEKSHTWVQIFTD